MGRTSQATWTDGPPLRGQSRQMATAISTQQARPKRLYIETEPQLQMVHVQHRCHLVIRHVGVSGGTRNKALRVYLDFGV